MICIGENVTKNSNVATTQELPLLMPQPHFKEAHQQGPNIPDSTPTTCHPVHGLYYFTQLEVVLSSWKLFTI